MEPLVMCENGGCLAKVGGSELTRLIGGLFGIFLPKTVHCLPLMEQICSLIWTLVR